MNSVDSMALLAVLLAATGVLPGTLGILMLTNRIAASPAGARYIYSQSALLIFAAVGLVVYLVWRQAQTGSHSIIVSGSAVAIALLLIYGYLMHAKMLFRPVREPVFIPINDALKKFGPDEEVVGVINSDGKPYAFVARLARRPHIVYQRQGDAPFIMTHCILAHSSMSYALQGNFTDPDLTITAALANNMVFYDKTSRCSVVQINNRLEGCNEPLVTVPTVALSLKTWQNLYPDSPVWTRSIDWRDVFYLKLLARADVIDPTSSMIVYPLQHPLDERLPMKSQVLGLFADGQARAYPVSVVANEPAINDQLGKTSLAIFCVNDYMQAFDRRIDADTILTFEKSKQERRFLDRQSGSEWTATGEAVEGTYSGRKLAPIPHYNKIFWYVWADYFPGSDIYSTAKGSDEVASLREVS